jgi:hypothetical protein
LCASGDIMGRDWGFLDVRGWIVGDGRGRRIGVMIITAIEWKRRHQRCNGQANCEEKSEEFHDGDLKDIREAMSSLCLTRMEQIRVAEA